MIFSWKLQTALTNAAFGTTEVYVSDFRFINRKNFPMMAVIQYFNENDLQKPCAFVSIYMECDSGSIPDKFCSWISQDMMETINKNVKFYFPFTASRPEVVFGALNNVEHLPQITKVRPFNVHQTQ